jgi:glycosyltransferase involved in cell wall biosynthesis/GT2 family glycosyltransferase
MPTSPDIALSVIIPTIRPAAHIRPTLDALDRQGGVVGGFEVIVVLDGAAGSRRDELLDTPRSYQMTVLVSTGHGRAAACDDATHAARGEILMFLDDDMVPEPDVLAAHLDRHHADRVAVMASVPVIVDDRATVATRFIARRFDRHTAKLASPGQRIGVRDVYTGAFSVERSVYLEVGGFDRRFREYGNEDGEFAGRLLRSGIAIVFAPDSIVRQVYAKSFAALTEDNVAKGRTAVQALRHHPDRAEESALRVRSRGSSRARLMRRVLVPIIAAESRRATIGRIVETAAAVIERIRPSAADRLISRFLDACFWAGVREATPVPSAATIIEYTDAAGAGGVERVVLTLTARLDRARWRPILVVPRSERPLLADDARRRGLTVIETDGGVTFTVRSVLTLARAFRRWRPALVHVHRSWAASGSAAVIAARLAGARVVATEHLFVPTTGRRTIALRRWIDRLVDTTVVVSEDLRTTSIQRLRRDAARITVIPNGIESPPARDPAAVEDVRAALAAQGPVILVPARLEPQKGHAVLLRALVEMPDVTAVFAGDGSHRASLGAMTIELGVADRVRFLGHRDDVPALMEACDLVVVPSIAEGMPLAVLEAFALHRPVVATAVGGTPELVTDGVTGRLVPPGEPDALRHAITEVLSDPALGQRLADAAETVARSRHTAQAMVSATEAVYEHVLGVHGRDSPKGRARSSDALYLTGRDRFGPTAVFGGSWDGVAERAERLVDADTAEPDSLDLALAEDPDAMTLVRIRTCLTEDGVLLARAGRSRSLRRRYIDAGFPDPRLYVAWPTARRPTAFIPLDDSVASATILGRDRRGLRARIGRIRRRGRFVSARVLRRNARFVVATPGGVPSLRGLDGWWRAAGFGPLPPRVTLALLTPGRESRSKVVAVLTPYDSDGPGLVVKWGRDADGARGIAREAVILDALAATPVSASIPRVVSVPDTEPSVRIVETKLAGRPLSWSASPADHERHAMAAAEFLAGLATGRQSVGSERWWEAAAAPIVDRFAAAVGSDRSLQAAICGSLRDLGDLPLVPEHRDFAPWNVLLAEDGTLGVTDWESAVEQGLPVLDLWYFLTYLALAVERQSEDRLARVYQTLMHPGSRTGRVSDRALSRYLDLMGLDREVAAPLRALTWMVHVPSEFARSDDRRSPADLTFAQLWRQEATAITRSDVDERPGLGS